MMKKKPLYIQILIRLAFLIVPILALYFLIVFNYDPHSRCDGEMHRHTMGPMFGFIIFSAGITFCWLIALIIEFIYKRFNKDTKVAGWLIFLVVLLGFALLFLI